MKLVCYNESNFANWIGSGDDVYSSTHTIRLNFATPTLNEIDEGMRRLGKAWKELLTRQSAAPQPHRRPAVPIL